MNKFIKNFIISFFVIIAIIIISLLIVNNNKQKIVNNNSENLNNIDNSNEADFNIYNEKENIDERGENDNMVNKKIKLKINNVELTATLNQNSSVEALISKLEKGSITIKMNDYENMEKVGSLGASLPKNDQNITTKAGDLILYQGNALVIYYEPNTWNFTKLGEIDNVTKSELKNILGKGKVTVTLSLD